MPKGSMSATFGTDILDEAPAVLDERRIAQVMVNLLSNAAKFSQSGGQVDLALTLQDERYRISVRDYGQGILPEMKEKVFETFTQGDNSDTYARRRWTRSEYFQIDCRAARWQARFRDDLWRESTVLLRTAGGRLSCVLDISFDIFQKIGGFRIDRLDNLFCHRFWTRRIDKRTRELRSTFDNLDVVAYDDRTSERCNAFRRSTSALLEIPSRSNSTPLRRTWCAIVLETYRQASAGDLHFRYDEMHKSIPARNSDVKRSREQHRVPHR